MQQIERIELTRLLEECQGNVTLASRKANMERQSMHRLIRRHGLRARDFRPRGGGSLIARVALRELKLQLA